MIIDLTEIESGSRPFDLTITRGDLDFDPGDLTLTSDVDVSGEITRRAAQIDVAGSIRAQSEVACARCLKPVTRPIAIDFSVNYVAPEIFSATKEHEVIGEDLDTDVLEDERVDVTEVVREQILLNLPEQTFCTEDCKGLCPKCGGDRNLIDCNCDEPETDPRWEALKNLRGSE